MNNERLRLWEGLHSRLQFSLGKVSESVYVCGLQDKAGNCWQ